MHDSEQHPLPDPTDEQDVEIVDLDTPARSARTTQRPVPSPLAPRFTARQRRTQLIVTVSIILLVLLVFLGSYGPSRSLLLRDFQPSTPDASTLNGFYIQAQPAWGQLSIDGKLITHLPIFDRDAPLSIGRGRHQLDWVAAPFKAQHCVVTVPANFRTDTCPLYSVTQTSSQTSVLLLTFSATMDLLPTTQRIALTQAIQSALDSQQSSEIVQPGERYATSNAQHPVAIATQPLRATLHFRIDTDTQPMVFCIDSLFGMASTSCRINNEDCRLLCETYFAQPATASHEWNTYGVISTLWDYATLDGHVIARDQPEIADGSGTNEHILPLRISWNGSTWHASTTFMVSDQPAPAANPVCFPAVDDFQLRGDMTANISASFSYTMQFVSGDVHAVGCLITVKLTRSSASDNNGSTPVVVSSAYVLQRFGVFLAVNATAHSLWPNFPIADDYERNIANQLQANVASGQNIRWQE